MHRSYMLQLADSVDTSLGTKGGGFEFIKRPHVTIRSCAVPMYAIQQLQLSGQAEVGFCVPYDAQHFSTGAQPGGHPGEPLHAPGTHHEHARRAVRPAGRRQQAFDPTVKARTVTMGADRVAAEALQRAVLTAATTPMRSRCGMSVPPVLALHHPAL
jgi:hypothetical protein